MRVTARRALMLLLTALIAGVSLVAHAAENTTMNTGFTVEAERIIADGRLLDSSGKAVKNVEIHATVDGKRVSSTKTRGNGRFEIVIPMAGGGTPGKTYRIKVEFPGNDKYSASSSLADYAVPGDHGGSDPNPPAPQPTKTQDPPAGQPTATQTQSAPATSEPPPPPAPEPAVLNAAALPASVSDSSTLSLNGSLTTADGQAISGAGIVVSDSRGEVTDSFTITTDDGSFSTLYDVPNGLSGPLTVTLSFSGMEGVEGVEKALTTTVEKVDVATAAPTVSATAEAAVSASAKTTGQTETTASPTASPEASAPPQVDAQLPAQPWVVVTLIGVGGLALMTVATLVFRGISGPRGGGSEVVGRRAAEAGGLDFLDDELREDD